MSKEHIQHTIIGKSNKELIPELISLINQGHTVTIGLKGNSMRPFLEDNRDKAIIDSVDSINIGDVVLAEVAKNKYVVHRIVNINNDRITLRGDGNIHTEECARTNIHGKVIGFYRKGRKTMESTQSFKWKLYSSIWMGLLPIRRYLLYINRQIVKYKNI